MDLRLSFTLLKKQ